MRSTDGCAGCGDKGVPDGVEPRYVDAPQALVAGHPVLGPTLGGGVSGSYLGSGVGRVGGGLTPPVLEIAAVPFDYPQARVDIHFDYTTPRRIFERGPNMLGPALDRELGGM